MVNYFEGESFIFQQFLMKSLLAKSQANIVTGDGGALRLNLTVLGRGKNGEP